MMQPHGGTTEGFHFPLRKGTEVVFNFLGGDPDRPVIAGVVPNAVNPSPVEQQNRTQNVIRTGANNHIILEDEAGKEFISIRTPNNNTGLYFGHPIGGGIESFDGETQRWNAGPEGSVRLFTTGTTHFNFGAEWHINCTTLDEFTTSKVKESYGGPHNTVVRGSGRKEEVTGLMDEYYNTGHDTLVTGPRNETDTGARLIKAEAGETHTVTGGAFETTSDTKVFMQAPIVHCHGKASMLHESPSITVDGKTVLVKGSASITLKAPSVKIESAGFEQNDPSGAWNFASFVWNGSKKTEFTGLSMGATGVKIEACGVAVGVSAYAGFTAGTKDEKAGTEVGVQGAKAESGGVVSFLKGFISLS
jgi:type VI secretion system secreted protein VgrG